jgi:hypothetical protein
VFGCWHHVVAVLREINPAAKSRNLWDMMFLTSKAHNLMSRYSKDVTPGLQDSGLVLHSFSKHDKNTGRSIGDTGY